MLIIESIRFFTDGKLDANEGSTNEPQIPERDRQVYFYLWINMQFISNSYLM